ncbi:amidohydrolase [Phycicoccus sonneratiae]|uniref:Amidohydrolase family protein n=1 Tax=Phycicoccus sonneratiae TaxID=2807628 RepID=A0ABS2CKR2_9MICO|nr:amidohydrolase family protein [Phycicoccus sonneraticus]MBM6399654.1 amidohydrolase family protein [Phycicoccus sonneraticus]
MPTTLFRRGRVRTPERSDATAFVVGDDGLLAWVGDDVGADGHADAVDAVVDLEGALVLPGFVDAHAHVSHTGLGMRGVDLSGTRTVTEALDLVAAAAREAPGAAVFAHGWQEQDWTLERRMTAVELDRASGGGVVYASRIDGHSAVVSSALVAVSGADGLDGWSPSGFVVRDAKNAARAAFDASRSRRDRRRDVEAALRTAAALGIVAVHECGGPLLTSAEDFADVLDLGRRAHLPATVGYWAEGVTDPEQARALAAVHGAVGLAGDLNIDGSIGSHTALLRGDYADEPGCRGTAYRDSTAVRDHVAACALAGVQSGFHVIGDAGLDLVLEGFERAAELVGVDVLRASRPRLEHAEMVDAAGIATMARLGIGASVQPAFDAYWGGREGMYAERLGADRGVATNPFASFGRAGVRMAFGADSPVTPFAPWVAIRAAVEHRDEAQRITAAAAVAAHTTGGRELAGTRGGELRVGSPATFAAWSVDALDSDGLPVLGGGSPLPECLLTVRAGVVLHDARG